MDPATIALIGVYALGKADKFLDVFLEKAGEDAYSKWKARNTAETIVEADRMLEESGRVVVGPVLGRIVMPILEGASADDDPDMRKLWAALLANAMTPGIGSKQLPGFSDILRQLTPVQAKILEWMFNRIDEDGSPIGPAFDRDDIEARFQLSSRDYAALMSDLSRLQLIARHIRHKEMHNLPLQDQMMHLTVELNDPAGLAKVRLTVFGVHFMMACTPPKPAT